MNLGEYARGPSEGSGPAGWRDGGGAGTEAAHSPLAGRASTRRRVLAASAIMIKAPSTELTVASAFMTHTQVATGSLPPFSPPDTKVDLDRLLLVPCAVSLPFAAVINLGRAPTDEAGEVAFA